MQDQNSADTQLSHFCLHNKSISYFSLDAITITHQLNFTHN